LYNILTFKEKISVSEVSGVNNTTLKQIDAIEFDKSQISPEGAFRDLKVIGKEKTKFSIKLTRSSDSKTYNFDTNLFTASSTTSSTKEIPSNGFLNTFIKIPSTSVLETYTLETTADADSISKLSSGLQDETGSLINTFTFKQSNDVTVTFTCVSSNSAYTGTHGSKPSSTAISGINNSSSNATNFIELQPKLHTKAFKKAKTSVESSDSITLTASNDKIVEGMTVTGTGITNTVTVSSISSTALVLSGSPGGTVSGTLTFTGVGFEFIQKATGLVFSTNGISNTDSNGDITIDSVSKTANADSSGTTITLANAESDNVGSVVGVYVETSTILDGPNAQGLGVTNVDSSQNTIVVDASRTIRSGQILNFTGAGRVAKINFQLNINKFPEKNTTVSINLDKLFTIDPNWS